MRGVSPASKRAVQQIVYGREGPAQHLCEMLVRLRDEVLCRRHAEKEALRRADQALPPPRRTLLLLPPASQA